MTNLTIKELMQSDFKQVAYTAGQWMVEGKREHLSNMYDQLRLLQQSDPDRAEVFALTALLDGFFAQSEREQHIERLVNEIRSDPMWEKILLLLQKKPITLRTVCRNIGAGSKKVRIALADLQQRELVETTQNKKGTTTYQLAYTGRQVLNLRL